MNVPWEAWKELETNYGLKPEEVLSVEYLFFQPGRSFIRESDLMAWHLRDVIPGREKLDLFRLFLNPFSSQKTDHALPPQPSFRWVKYQI